MPNSGHLPRSEAALEFLSRETVDVLFLDIQMPGVERIRAAGPPARAAASHFHDRLRSVPLQAFEVNSIDYLLKPVDRRQLERALAKLDRLRGAPASPPDLREVMKHWPSRCARGAPLSGSHRLAHRRAVQLLDLARVTHFFARDKLTFAASGGRAWRGLQHLDLEQKLDPHKFLRIHRAIS